MVKWPKNNGNDDDNDNEVVIVIFFGNVDVDHVQTLEKISVEFTNSHLWSIIMPYLAIYLSHQHMLSQNCLSSP